MTMPDAVRDAVPSLLRRVAFLRCAGRAFRAWAREMRYYARARLPRDLPDADPAVRVRGLAHGLERVLFHPGRHDPADARARAGALRAELDRGDPRVPSSQAAWAARILREYDAHAADPSRPACPMAAAGAPRRPAPVSAGDLLDLMRRRRSRRMFRPEPLTREERAALVEAALHAPTACNRQTLEFLFVEDRDARAFVAANTAGGREFLADAPCILLVLADARHYRYPDDRVNPHAEAGAAIENIYLLAETMGLGCCWASFTSLGSVRDERGVRRRLRIPDRLLILAAVALGRSDQSVCPIPRPDPERRLHLDTWGRRPS
jgi:nitroreductase